MRVLMVHNRYLQRGGEDESTDAEVALLRRRGHHVELFETDSRETERLGRIRTAARAVWARTVHREVHRRLVAGGFDLLHVQNFFPLISPSVHWAGRAAGVTVVQALRNYRLLCVNAVLFRDGHRCRDCVGRALPWPGVVHRCYRDSAAASAAVAAMQVTHRGLGTWWRAVDAFIGPSEFARSLLEEGGLPAERIHVKPNFVDPDPGPGPGGDGFLFVGRLAPEKGVATLLDAWQRLGARAPELTLVGDGPLALAVRRAAAGSDSLRWAGRLPLAEVWERMGRCRALIFPSEWYETFGRVAAEAFSRGTPVVASRLGAVAEMIDHGRSGLLFEPGDAADLAAQVVRLQELDVAGVSAMRAAARAEFERNYTGERNYEMLTEIYAAARVVREGRGRDRRGRAGGRGRR